MSSPLILSSGSRFLYVTVDEYVLSKRSYTFNALRVFCDTLIIMKLDYRNYVKFKINCIIIVCGKIIVLNWLQMKTKHLTAT